jgi:hypothetical protein
VADAWGGSWAQSWGSSWGAGEAQVESAETTKGRAEWLMRVAPDRRHRRSRKEISDARLRFGLKDALAQETIVEVAKSQVARAEVDPQKQFEELARELQLRQIEFSAGHLEALAIERERLISEEIKRRLLQQREDEQVITLVMLAAGAVI